MTEQQFEKVAKIKKTLDIEKIRLRNLKECRKNDYAFNLLIKSKDRERSAFDTELDFEVLYDVILRAQEKYVERLEEQFKRLLEE